MGKDSVLFYLSVIEKGKRFYGIDNRTRIKGERERKI